jgi:hypothetical protein|tara:strand:+ start:1191 stop:2024 length:834 start_codon:yes stop_codon:yes gene_type:complete
MAEMNLREAVCKVSIKINDLSVDRESGTVTFLYDQNASDKGRDFYLKLFNCIGKISKNRERKKSEEKFGLFVLDSDLLTRTMLPNEYFEILYRFENEMFGPIKKDVCNELFLYFLIIQSSIDDLKNQNEMIDNSVYDSAGKACVQDVYDSLVILHSLSKGESFMIEVEGHDKIEIHIPEVPPRPISTFDNESIKLSDYRVKGTDYDLNQLTVISRAEKGKKDILFNPEDFNRFHIEYVKGFLSGNLFFDFVVQEVIGKKFNVISFSKQEENQVEIDY